MEVLASPADAVEIIRVLLPAVAVAVDVLDAEGAMAVIAQPDIPLEARSANFRAHLSGTGAKCRALLPSGDGVISILAAKWTVEYLKDSE